MKKQFIIILIMLSTCIVFGQIVSKASVNQSNGYKPLKNFKGDTLGYVQHNFIDNKQKYIGKDLNTLLNDVEIPIKSYLPSISDNDPTIIPAIYLDFYTRDQVIKKKNSSDKPVDIIIKWSLPLPIDSVYNLWNNCKGEWTDAECKYYGKQTIGDILTTKWHK